MTRTRHAPNTLTLIKIKNGNIFGGFVDVKWSRDQTPDLSQTSIMFLIAPDGPLQLLTLKDNDVDDILHKRREPIFGLNFNWFMKEFELNAGIHKEVLSGLPALEKSSYMRLLSVGPSAFSVIDHIRATTRINSVEPICRDPTSCTLLERVRKDTEHADVDLVFEGGVVLTAHANILAAASDYYKEALSSKWAYRRETNMEEILEGKLTVTHPNVDTETANVVLDYIYLGDVDVPLSLIYSVIAYADEILVPKLVQKWIDCIVNKNKLSPNNALECYLHFNRVHANDNSKSYALSKMLQNLPLSLEFGREVLAQMNEKEVEMLLLFEPFEPLHRWRILIAWCKAYHDAQGDLSLESKLPENFPIEVASKLIEPLLIVVELIKIPATNFNLLEPFKALLPTYAQDMLAFHLKGTTRSGGNQWKATHQDLMEIMRAIKQYLPVDLQSHNSATDPVLLFHGTPGTSIHSDLHKACDGTLNTLTLLKMKNGNMFGGFVDVEWTKKPISSWSQLSFIFLIVPNGPFQLLSLKKSEAEDIYYVRHGPQNGMNFYWFMKEFAKAAETHKDVFSGFDEKDRRAFFKKLSAG
ncbi:hypothetical protein HDU80_002735, partial [Chytriomyces hyalinus]